MVRSPNRFEFVKIDAPLDDHRPPTTDDHGGGSRSWLLFFVLSDYTVNPIASQQKTIEICSFVQ
jgi:hypothetical protein